MNTYANEVKIYISTYQHWWIHLSMELFYLNNPLLSANA